MHDAAEKATGSTLAKYRKAGSFVFTTFDKHCIIEI